MGRLKLVAAGLGPADYIEGVCVALAEPVPPESKPRGCSASARREGGRLVVRRIHYDSLIQY